MTENNLLINILLFVICHQILIQIVSSTTCKGTPSEFLCWKHVVYTSKLIGENSWSTEEYKQDSNLLQGLVESAEHT